VARVVDGDVNDRQPPQAECSNHCTADGLAHLRVACNFYCSVVTSCRPYPERRPGPLSLNFRCCGGQGRWCKLSVAAKARPIWNGLLAVNTVNNAPQILITCLVSPARVLRLVKDFSGQRAISKAFPFRGSRTWHVRFVIHNVIRTCARNRQKHSQLAVVFCESCE